MVEEPNIFVPCDITENVVNILFKQVKQRHEKKPVDFYLGIF